MQLIGNVYAQSTGGAPAQLSGLQGIFTNIIGDVIGLAGIVLFIILLLGGFGYLTAGGDPARTQSAQKTLTYAILGIVFIAVSYLILVLIKTFTGVDVTTFKIIQ